MSVKIFRTRRADQQLKGRRKDEQKKVIAFLRDLEANGCAALSYRLYRLVGHEPESSEKRTKPPCCGEDGSAPVLGQAAEDLALRASEIRKNRR